MVQLVNIIAYLIVISIFLLFVYAILYFLLFLVGKVLGRQLLNNFLLKILYVLTSLPFFFCGLYILSLLFLIKYEVGLEILMGIFGIFLVAYSIYRAIRKIKDIEFFGGV